MSELSLPSSSKSAAQFANILFSDLKLLCSYIHSHPLYFSYFIFFSPYLFKLISFLSPLFITTSLLLLGLLTLCPQSKGGFVLSAYESLKEKLLSSNTINELEDYGFHQLEELEVYKLVFDTSPFSGVEISDDVQMLRSEEKDYEANKEEEKPVIMYLFEALDTDLEEKTVEVDWEEISAKPFIQEKKLEEFFEPLENFENMPLRGEEKENEVPSFTLDNVEVEKEVLPKITSSKEIVNKIADKDINFLDNKNVFSKETVSKIRDDISIESSLGSYGSMRREKEWKRTLACKLFEERNRGNDEEGMDLLWETYENDSSTKAKKKNNSKNKKKDELEYYTYVDDCDEDERMNNGQLCCLQALKFSTGKMNLGMKKPSLVKFSKVIKGFGWLHNVNKHSKKGYSSK